MGDQGIEAMDDDLITGSYSKVEDPPNEWQVKRGYCPIKNPKARFHANGKYATGIYKKWLEKHNVK